MPRGLPLVALVILDGWGCAPPGPGNAVDLAETPVFDRLWAEYPHTRLEASGEAAGLPPGQMGNSEVGHLTIGSGRRLYQDLMRVNKAIADGSLFDNPALRAAFERGRRVNLIGLVSHGGVHSHIDHLQALLRFAPEKTWIHAFTDGRDVSPTAGLHDLAELPADRIATVVGRYWAMDRDKRWERIQRAYDLLVHGRAEQRAASGAEAAREAYERDETDEFITPVLVGEAESCIRPGDSVFAFNFRPDRMREITRAVAEPGFDEIDRGGAEAVERYATMTQYEEDFDYPVAFPPERPEVTLPRVLAEHGARQLHVAETEKYAHVTYFFSSGEEEPFEGERRELVDSPRDVPTYDKKPEMSAPGAAEAFVRVWREDEPTFGIINFANPDMVGHTGVIEAAVRAVETVDRCLGNVVTAVHESGGACLITADHGNADHMLEDDGSPNTAHSLNPVPFIVTVPDVRLRDEGVLADVAPTVLEILGIEQPEAMTGESMLQSD
jgi:2,3-bisphosphoglycerate-independent phosphoglycerate mutase